MARPPPRIKEIRSTEPGKPENNRWSKTEKAIRHRQNVPSHRIKYGSDTGHRTGQIKSANKMSESTGVKPLRSDQLQNHHPNADTLARSGEDEVSRGKRMGYNGS
eukprot:gene28518-31676_t